MVFYEIAKRCAKTALDFLKTAVTNIFEATLKQVFIACGKIAGRFVGKAVGAFVGESLISAFYMGQHDAAIGRDIGSVLGEEIFESLGEKLAELLATKLLHWINGSDSDSSDGPGSD